MMKGLKALLAVTIILGVMIGIIFLFDLNPFKTWLDYIAFPISACLLIGVGVAIYFIFTAIYDFIDSVDISFGNNSNEAASPQLQLMTVKCPYCGTEWTITENTLMAQCNSCNNDFKVDWS